MEIMLTIVLVGGFLGLISYFIRESAKISTGEKERAARYRTAARGEEV